MNYFKIMFCIDIILIGFFGGYSSFDIYPYQYIKRIHHFGFDFSLHFYPSFKLFYLLFFFFIILFTYYLIKEVNSICQKKKKEVNSNKIGHEQLPTIGTILDSKNRAYFNFIYPKYFIIIHVTFDISSFFSFKFTLHLICFPWYHSLSII